ncbi:MAG: MaoC family dehydratase, partial [Actinomycetota bacterium]
MTLVIDGAEDLRRRLGTHLGYSEWLEIDQARIDEFAEATGDHQWIHGDPVRAAAGPFGAPIAHGYLTLSLSNYFLPRIVEVRGFDAGVNYGVDKVRFPSPVTVGSRIRAGAELVAIDE